MRVQRKHRIGAVVFLAAAALVTVSLWPEPVAVDAATVDRGPLRVTVDEDGETRVRDRYVVASPVTGRLVRLNCEIGDEVRAGEVVARVFPLPMDTRTRGEAAARLEAAQASRQAARAALAGAETTRDDAERSLERLRRVDASVPGAVAPARLDAASAAADAARHAVEQAQATLDAAARNVEQAQASLIGADDAAGSEPTLVRAPAGGRILRLYEECERAVAAGAPLLEIGDPSELEVVVDVLTEDATRLREGAAARITWPGATDTIVGRIHRIEPSAFTKVSPLGVEEQRVDVIVRFGGAPVLLGDRFRVDAALVVWEAADALRVPVGALFRRGADWAVFVEQGGRARERRVQLGERGRDFAQVAEGLLAGERVVLFPTEALRDGVRIE